MMTTRQQRVRTITKPINTKQKYIAWKISYKHEHLEIIIKTRRADSLLKRYIECVVQHLPPKRAELQKSCVPDSVPHGASAGPEKRSVDKQLQRGLHPRPLRHSCLLQLNTHMQCKRVIHRVPYAHAHADPTDSLTSHREKTAITQTLLRINKTSCYNINHRNKNATLNKAHFTLSSDPNLPLLRRTKVTHSSLQSQSMQKSYISNIKIQIHKITIETK